MLRFVFFKFLQVVHRESSKIIFRQFFGYFNDDGFAADAGWVTTVSDVETLHATSLPVAAVVSADVPAL